MSPLQPTRKNSTLTGTQTPEKNLNLTAVKPKEVVADSNSAAAEPEKDTVASSQSNNKIVSLYNSVGYVASIKYYGMY